MALGGDWKRRFFEITLAESISAKGFRLGSVIVAALGQYPLRIPHVAPGSEQGCCWAWPVPPLTCVPQA